MSAVAEAHAHGHGDHPPAAHQSSRVNHVLLGIYLFIASEAMLFGSFFAAYFFARVSAGPETWPPEPYHVPVFLAGVNTIILVTSSFTVHWATHSLRTNHRPGLIAGLGLTMLLGLTFLLIQIIEYTADRLQPARSRVRVDVLRPDRPPRPPRLRRPLLLTMAFARSLRGHYSPQTYLGVEVPAIYWHFVDVMWIVVYVTVYVI